MNTLGCHEQITMQYVSNFAINFPINWGHNLLFQVQIAEVVSYLRQVALPLLDVGCFFFFFFFVGGGFFSFGRRVFFFFFFFFCVCVLPLLDVGCFFFVFVFFVCVCVLLSCFGALGHIAFLFYLL